jgi:hypothetical protein
MTRGAVIPIHVNDPQGLLAPSAGSMQMDCRFQVVAAKGLLYDAAIVARSATSRDYAITVPFGTQISVRAFSPNLMVNDASGAPATSAGTSMSMSAGFTQQPLTYTVSAVKP